MENTFGDFLCKTCGAHLNELAAQSANGLVTCPYCNNVWTIPKKDTSSASLQFLRMGEHDLDTCKFDDAFSAYQKAAELDAEEPEAFFGMALAEFRVQYLKDEVSDPPRLQPICHEISNKNFLENKNFQTALKLATSEQKAEYMRRAQEIVKIRLEFLKLKESGLDYDSFICVKVSDDNGGTTQDSHEALKLYHYLKDRGYSPFYSEEEVAGRSGADYEALILYALYSAECMLIVCSNEDYLQTKWVKNEYTRFSKMIARNGKESDALTFVFRGMPIEHLPGRDEKIQGIDLSKPDAYSRIEEYISSFNPIRIGGPVEIKRKEYTGGAYQKKNVKRSGVTKRKLATGGGGEVSVSDKAKLNIANDFLSRRAFGNAAKYLDGMLNENPTNGGAYFLRFLARHNCVNESDYLSYGGNSINYEDFERAISYAQDDARRSELYGLLARHVLQCLDLLSYKEYIELPDSKEEVIDNLTEAMYKKALQNCDKTLFAEVIKAVTNTDKFVKMNLEFAHAVDGYDKIAYYKNILSADEGHGEALWFTYALNHGENKALLDYCAENTDELEKELFAFGYNSFANEQLFNMCLDNINKDTENALKLFDFVLSMIPKTEDKIFKDYVNNVIARLFEINQIKYINKYNEMLLAIDKLDDDAYFNRVMLKNKYHNYLELMYIADKLFDDEDYFSAVNSYTEKNPDKSNYYIDLQNTLTALAKTVHDEECRKFLIANCYLNRQEIMEYQKKTQKVLVAEAKKYLGKVYMKYKAYSIDKLYNIKKKVAGDPDLRKAQIYAENSGDVKLNGDICGLIENQAKVVKAHKQEKNKKRSQTIGGVIGVIAFVVVGIVVVFFVLAFIMQAIGCGSCFDDIFTGMFGCNKLQIGQHIESFSEFIKMSFHKLL